VAQGPLPTSALTTGLQASDDDPVFIAGQPVDGNAVAGDVVAVDVMEC
jgi:hypothetical protein